MLSGSTDISIDGGMGVHMAAIALPNGSQGFVGITSPAMYGMAYLDPDTSNQVIYNAGSSTSSDSFTFSYVDGMGQTDTYTVNVTITGSGSGSGSGSASGSGYGSGSGSGSASGSGSGFAYAASSGSGSASSSGSAAATPPSIATLEYRNSITSGGKSDGEYKGILADDTPTSSNIIVINTGNTQLPPAAPPSDVNNMYYTNDNDRNFWNNSDIDVIRKYNVSGIMVAGQTEVWATVGERNNMTGLYEFVAWRQFGVNDGVPGNASDPIVDIAASVPINLATSSMLIPFGSSLSVNEGDSRDTDTLGGGIEHWNWTLGASGTPIDATSHDFSWDDIVAAGGTSGGSVTVQLTVIDNEGQTNSKSLTVNIETGNPDAVDDTATLSTNATSVEVSVLGNDTYYGSGGVSDVSLSGWYGDVELMANGTDLEYALRPIMEDSAAVREPETRARQDIKEWEDDTLAIIEERFANTVAALNMMYAFLNAQPSAFTAWCNVLSQGGVAGATVAGVFAAEYTASIAAGLILSQGAELLGATGGYSGANDWYSRTIAELTAARTADNAYIRGLADCERQYLIWEMARQESMVPVLWQDAFGYELSDTDQNGNMKFYTAIVTIDLGGRKDYTQYRSAMVQYKSDLRSRLIVPIGVPVPIDIYGDMLVQFGTDMGGTMTVIPGHWDPGPILRSGVFNWIRPAWDDSSRLNWFGFDADNIAAELNAIQYQLTTRPDWDPPPLTP